MSTLKAVLQEYWADRPMELAAALSYYTILSLAPLVLMTVAVAGLFFERAAVEGRVVNEMRTLVGQEGAQVAEAVLRSAGNREKDAVSLLVGTLFLLVGATSVFGELQEALNRFWNVSATSRRSALSTLIKEGFLSLAMVMSVGFLLLVSLLVHTGLSALRDSARGWLIDDATVLNLLATPVALAVTALLFAAMFKILPDTDVAWRDVWLGALITAVLFTLGKRVIGLYLRRAAIGSAYGAAGSLVALTVWVYYASMIMFFGAKLTAIRARESRGAAATISSAGGR